MYDNDSAPSEATRAAFECLRRSLKLTNASSMFVFLFLVVVLLPLDGVHYNTWPPLAEMRGPRHHPRTPFPRDHSLALDNLKADTRGAPHTARLSCVPPATAPSLSAPATHTRRLPTVFPGSRRLHPARARSALRVYLGPLSRPHTAFHVTTPVPLPPRSQPRTRQPESRHARRTPHSSTELCPSCHRTLAFRASHAHPPPPHRIPAQPPPPSRPRTFGPPRLFGASIEASHCFVIASPSRTAGAFHAGGVREGEGWRGRARDEHPRLLTTPHPTRLAVPDPGTTDADDAVEQAVGAAADMPAVLSPSPLCTPPPSPFAPPAPTFSTCTAVQRRPHPHLHRARPRCPCAHRPCSATPSLSALCTPPPSPFALFAPAPSSAAPSPSPSAPCTPPPSLCAPPVHAPAIPVRAARAHVLDVHGSAAPSPSPSAPCTPPLSLCAPPVQRNPVLIRTVHTPAVPVRTVCARTILVRTVRGIPFAPSLLRCPRSPAVPVCAVRAVPIRTVHTPLSRCKSAARAPCRPPPPPPRSPATTSAHASAAVGKSAARAPCTPPPPPRSPPTPSPHASATAGKSAAQAPWRPPPPPLGSLSANVVCSHQCRGRRIRSASAVHTTATAVALLRTSRLLTPAPQ
ncbi:hypothetical protein PLICRDRAFT_180653 [Plicaturopsis crispa FD-325 SS-3]|uniref:Uncharacterized protein n=1 Tax=Plicaturopsis crispa FD-325 SS-3 TaxID=944288 RepID=A0A0C9SPZ5_PLICR|nr:hypothetical protein PLICRDRAFT_180653 [Plicaturopsis crispa FD-325 SS-3]